eukprot:748698-Hanusia_phi.AAC.2
MQEEAGDLGGMAEGIARNRHEGDGKSVHEADHVLQAEPDGLLDAAAPPGLPLPRHTALVEIFGLEDHLEGLAEGGDQG